MPITITVATTDAEPRQVVLRPIWAVGEDLDWHRELRLHLVIQDDTYLNEIAVEDTEASREDGPWRLYCRFEDEWLFWDGFDGKDMSEDLVDSLRRDDGSPVAMPVEVKVGDTIVFGSNPGSRHTVRKVWRWNDSPEGCAVIVAGDYSRLIVLEHLEDDSNDWWHNEHPFTLTRSPTDPTVWHATE